MPCPLSYKEYLIREKLKKEKEGKLNAEAISYRRKLKWEINRKDRNTLVDISVEVLEI